MMYFCGATSFSHVDDDDGGSWANSSSRRPFKLKLKLKKSLGKRANLYSASGLDKFEKLLTELEAEKKRVLLLNNGSDEDTVRFRYRSNTGERIPILIKRPQLAVPAKKKKKKKKAAAAEVQVVEEAQLVVAVATDSTRKLRRRWSCWDWISSVPCWAVVMVLVLLCMTFGRAFAVSWAAILWYMLPMMMKCSNKNSSSSSSCNLKRKKEHGN